jgi:hypothetical protein
MKVWFLKIWLLLELVLLIILVLNTTLQESSFAEKAFFTAKQRPKSVLIIEIFNHHEECLLGYAAYFIDLGYNVDVVKFGAGMKEFCLFDKKRLAKLRVFSQIGHIRNLKQLREQTRHYEYIFINSFLYVTNNVYVLVKLTEITNWPNCQNVFCVIHDTRPCDSLKEQKVLYIIHYEVSH